MNNLDQLGNPMHDNIINPQEWVEIPFDQLEVGKYYIGAEEGGIDGMGIMYSKVKIEAKQNNELRVKIYANMAEGDEDGEIDMEGLGEWGNWPQPGEENRGNLEIYKYYKKAIGINANNNIMMMDGGRRKTRKAKKTHKSKKTRKAKKSRRGRK